jgi:ATP-dependent RNA helicase RhlE
MAAGVAKKATLPEREGGDRNEGGRGRRGGRNPHRDGVRPEGGGQPHRQRRNRPGEAAAAPRPERAYNPLAGEKITPREPRPEGEMKRRPRRRPSNGGKGYGAAKG